MSSTSGGESKSKSGRRNKRQTEDDISSDNPSSLKKPMKKVLFTNPNGLTFSSISGQIPIPTQNRFEELSDHDGDEMDTDQIKPKKPVTRNPRPLNSTRKVKIPPIVIPNASKKIVVDLIKSLSIDEFHTKITSVGLYVYMKTVDNYKMAREKFISQGLKFFSHDLQEEKLFKVVVTRLEESDAKELESALKSHGFSPIEVKEFPPKIPRYKGHMNYLVSFKKDSVKLNDLRKYTLICHSSVRYDPYRPSKNNSTQCRNCLMPGHGTRNCKLDPKCMHCGSDDHASENCAVFNQAMNDAKATHEAAGKSTKDVIELNFNYVCANCKGSHRGDDKDCPKKKEYAELQRRLSDRNRRSFSKQQFTPRQDANRQPMSTLTVKNGLSYSNAANMGSTWQKADSSREFAPGKVPHPNFPPNEPVSNDNSNLFSYEEINCILRDMMGQLSTCRTKADQLNVMLSLSIKYLYGPK